MLTALFWLSLIGAGFSYFLYPAVLAVLVWRAGPRPVASAAELPRVSLIVTAHNEEARIGGKLENALDLDYPPDRIELLVASDSSTDGTDHLVMSYAHRGVTLVRAHERLGKENAQREAIAVAKGDILVFSDVATEMPPDALKALVRYFEDSTVGAVSSEDRFVSQDGKVAGEGLYVRYEMWLRRLESSLAGLVGLSGSFFAARREVCAEWDIRSPSDFNTALNCARLGLRAVTAPDVLGYYRDLKDPAKEYARKVRTVLRGMTGLARHAEVLNPVRFGLFAFQVFGHKLMRWLVPLFLVLLLLSSVVLAPRHPVYALALLGQLAFYGVAFAAWRVEALREVGPVRIVFFFVQVNVAIAQAAWRFLSGERMIVWQPSAR